MTQLPLELKRRERTAVFLWTAFVLMFFVVQAILWTVAISVTSRDSSHAVVEGYDEQAFHWDDVKRLRADSDALGWNANIDVDDKEDLLGHRVVTVSLKDRDQTPLEDAQVELQAYHRAHAAEKQKLKLEQIRPGVYSSTVIVLNGGHWQFSGMATSDEDKFLIEQRIVLNANGSL